MASNTEKRITAKFILDSSGFNSSLRGVNAELRNTQSQLKLASTGIKAYGTSSERLKSVQESLSRQTELHSKKVDIYKQSIEKTTDKMNLNIKERDKLKTSLDSANKKYTEAVKIYGKESTEAKKAKEEVDKLKQEHEKASKAVETNAKQVQGYETNLNKANEKMVQSQAELKKLNREIAEQDNKWIQASKGMERHSEKLKNVGGKITGVGKDISKVSIPIAAVGLGAAKSAIEFESAFTGVKKTVDGTNEQFAQLEKGIRDMSKIMPQSAVEISGVAEAAGQLGIKTESILGFTKTMVMLGDSTNMSSDQAATALARLANITQMPQNQFDKLGSVVVALGNNLATTESEIVDMGLRLAGAGKQVGMTEAQTLSLAGALSSVGIEAEAGGSAMSKVLINMDLAVAKGGKSLDGFAKTAGMSSQQFQKAFKEDAAGALTEFVKGLGNAEKNGTSAIKILDGMGISEVRMRDTLLRAAGAGDLLNNSLKIGTKAWKDNNALTNEANQRYATTESQLKMAKNQIKDAGITIGKNLIPPIKDLAVKVAETTNKFAALSPEAQKSIVKFGGFIAILGPAVIGIGKFTTGIGGILKVSAKVAGGIGRMSLAMKGAEVATASTTVATGVATNGIGAMGMATKLGALALNPWTLGIAAAGIGVYALVKHLKKDAVPAVDLFADGTKKTTRHIEGFGDEVTKANVKISEGTKKAVGAYIKMDDDVTKSLSDLYVNSTKITGEQVNGIVGQYTQMATTIKQGMDKKNADEIKSMQELFAKSSSLTAEEQAKVLENMKVDNTNKKVQTDNYTKQIQAILQKASTEKRELTSQEQQQINAIQDKMKVTAVKHLSDSEVESKVIMERLKGYSGRITAQQASETIKNAEKQRSETVKKANSQYDQTVASIVRMRDETGTITSAQAEKMIKDAERQRKETVSKANDQKQQVVGKIKEMNHDIGKSIDTSTGENLSKWQRFAKWWRGWHPENKTFTTTHYVDTYSFKHVSTRDPSVYKGMPGHAAGTNYFEGGLTTLHEKGYEVYNLERGTRIYNHEASEDMVIKTAESVAGKVAKSMLNNFGGNNKAQTIIVPVNLDGREIARVTTPYVSNNLAVNTRGRR